jgi:hypothetical protein
MNIEDAMNKVKNQPNQGETLHVVGSIEKDADGGKIRVYPDPYDMSRYVLIDPQSIAGEVLDITEHRRQTNPSQRNLVFSVPVRKGAEIQIVSVITIPVTDVAKLRRLSLDQSGRCSCKDGSVMRSCHFSECTTVGGENYDCWEDGDDGLKYCSGCCYVV